MINKKQFDVFKSKVEILLKHFNAGNYSHVLKETERLKLIGYLHDFQNIDGYIINESTLNQ